MIDPANVPEVAPSETLARFILYGKHIRPSDQTLKPDAFMPHPYLDLSVTRHLLASEDELWTVGQGIAELQGRPLHGRGDIRADTCDAEGLRVQADPVEGNPNHAIVVDWPAEKSAQKSIAQQIAAAAKFTPRF
jgi:hypothetical protein